MLLDREGELSLAAQALRRADAGRGSLLVVSGPLGIGRSALLDRIGERAAAAGATVLRAWAAATERDFSLGLARQLLEPALLGASDAVVRRWTGGAAEQAPRLLTGDPDPVPGREEPDGAGAVHAEAGLRSLTALVENMAADECVAVLVDDLQWADTATLCWLRHLAGRAGSARVLLVCSLRDGESLGRLPEVREVVEQAEHVLRLEPLAADAARSLVRGAWREPVAEEFTEACLRASFGNPLLLTSLLDEAATRGISPLAGNAMVAAGLRPPLLRQRLQLCLESQSEQVRKLARALAVLGDAADRDVLSRLCGLAAPARDSGLRTLADLGLLVDGAPPRFVHPVVVDAVAESMSLTERDALHAAAADVLRLAGRTAEEAAGLLMAVSTPQGPWATHILGAAAAESVRCGAPERAVRYLRRALLECPAQDAERGRLLVSLAAAERSFAPAAAVRHMAQAVPLLDTPTLRADAVAHLGPLQLMGSFLPVRDLLRHAGEGLADTASADGREQELALRLEARTRILVWQDAEELAGSVARLESLGEVPPMDTGGERELLMALLGAAWLANAVPAERVARLGGLILQREPATPVHAHGAMPILVSALTAADSVRLVGDWLDLAHQRAVDDSMPVERIVTESEQALVLLASGRLTEARQRALDAFTLAEAEHEELLAVAAIALAMVTLESRDYGLARQLLAGRYQTSASQEPHLWALLTMLKGNLAMSEGDLRIALDHFLDAGQRLEQSGWRTPALVPWGSCAALLHHRLGHERQAAELSGQEVERARAWGAPAALGRALTVQARAASGSRATALLRQAVEVLEESANRLELCRALVALGERLGPALPGGEAALRRAGALARQCGAGWIAERVSARLGPAQPGPAPAPGRLTPAELKVAELAASGLTNQAIADDLGITTRAVEKHLTNCYRKMSIKGRPVLAAALRQLEETSSTPIPR